MAAAMKLGVLFAVLAVADCIRLAARTTRGGTIAAVVSTLQGMLDKSKSDGLGERALYAKYKCYCDTNEEEKTTSIEDLTKEIALLESEIDGMQGSTGELSTEVATLKAKMDENDAAQKQSQGMRDKENADFLENEKDLKEGIAQMKLAVETLSAIGADQTLVNAQEHKQFMAGYGDLLALKVSVNKAMGAADSFLPRDLRLRAVGLLQAPFTGTYSSQSGEVVGILKSMRDTFEANLATATSTEKAQKEAFDTFMLTLTEAFDKMKAAFDKKQGIMSGNDESLSGKVSALKNAKTQLDDDGKFLATLTDMCDEKSKDYEKRKMFRANEEAAIAQAVSILNSDRSAEAMGKVSSGSAKFLQLRAVRRHLAAAPAAGVRAEVRRLLRDAAHEDKSRRLAKIASLLSVEKNPFATVLTEIVKMKALVGKEAELDKTHLDWCTEERKVNNNRIGEKDTALTNLEEAVDQVKEDIEHPETGYIAMIKQKEGELQTNRQAQTDDTAARREENAQYQESIANTVQAENLLEKAIVVLQEYYADLKSKQIGLLQKSKDDPAPPSTWDGPFAGQDKQGATVITMLQAILDDNHAEQKTVHGNEQEAQHAYEDSMETLTGEEKDLVDSLAELEKDYMDAKMDREEKHADHDQTFQDRRAIVRYLESIAPACDFVTDNYDLREANRGKELSALKLAETKLKGTPAFAKAEAADLRERRGACAEPCEANSANVECKACMADVSVPGYCAGHAGTDGC